MKALRQAREAKGITRLDFASMIGVSYGYLAQVETEKYRASKPLLQLAAIKLGLPEEHFLSGGVQDEYTSG